MHLYDQLLKLQYLENAYNEWIHYRNNLTHFIINQTTRTDKIALIGAGRCNDIDLSQITSHVQSITLVDKDYEGMKEALKRYQLEENVHVNLLEKDLVGITDEDYRQYADKLIAEVRQAGYQTDCSKLAHMAQALIDKLVANPLNEHLDLGCDTFDTVVAIGVHSQLLSMLEWIWSIILQTIRKEEMTVREDIMRLNTLFVKRLNNALIESTKNHLIIGCEKERIGRVGTIQGAVQCLDDMTKRCGHQVVLVNTVQMEWPFNLSQQTAYAMQINTYKKDTCLSSKKGYNKE